MANNPYVNKVVFGSATLVDLTGTTATADKILSGYGAYGADGAWMDGTATASSGSGYVWQDENGYVHLDDEGSSPIIIEPLSVTQNGTYTAPTGTAYSPVTVNVSGGGASNYVTGTFTGTTTGAAMDITIPYSGTGYPIAIDVCVSEGASNANGVFYNTLQRYAVAFWMGNKDNTETPTYIVGYSPNFFTSYCRYKSSDTAASATAGGVGTQASTLADANAGALRDAVIRMKSPTVMSVYIASTSYGFMANIEYTYHIMYSE